MSLTCKTSVLLMLAGSFIGSCAADAPDSLAPESTESETGSALPSVASGFPSSTIGLPTGERAVEGVWNLVRLQIGEDTVEPGTAQLVIRDGELGGSGECSGIGGQVEILPDESSIRFRNINEDLFGCGDAAADAQEVFLRRLSQVERYEVEDDSLCLEGDDARMCFERAS